MFRYILKRLLMMIPVLIGVSLLVYVICGTNTDPIVVQLAGAEATPEDLIEVEKALGFDRPVLVRYIEYMGGLVRGDLGRSHLSNAVVWEEFLRYLPLTIKLSFGSVLVSIAIALPLGIISALKQGTLLDNFSMVGALVGMSMPAFWLGLLLLLAFSMKLRIFPSGGANNGIMSFILPALTAGISLTGGLTRQTRSSMLEVIRADYLRTARAKGCGERTVILKHALRNALIPIITLIGAQIAQTLAGSSVVETVFALPGIGRQVVVAVGNRDVNMVTGFVVLQAMITAIVMLGVDLVYALADPRIKAQFAKGGK